MTFKKVCKLAELFDFKLKKQSSSEFDSDPDPELDSDPDPELDSDPDPELYSDPELDPDPELDSESKYDRYSEESIDKRRMGNGFRHFPCRGCGYDLIGDDINPTWCYGCNLRN